MQSKLRTALATALVLAVSAAAAVFAATPSKADIDTRYYVDLSFPTTDSFWTGSAKGYIQTDGTLGVLTQDHITGWHLELSPGFTTLDLAFDIPCVSACFTENFFSWVHHAGVLVGSALTATDTGLFFNFGNADGSSLRFSQESAIHGWEYQHLIFAAGGEAMNSRGAFFTHFEPPTNLQIGSVPWRRRQNGPA